MMSLITGMLSVMSSGCLSRPALYSGYSSWRNVLPPGGSKHTAIYGGLCLVRISLRVLQKPYIAEVLRPSEVVRGLLMRA